MPKVLIVDDDPGVLQTFARMLHLDGCEVLTAADADLALRSLAIFKPDAVLVDLRLPQINGLAFVRQLRAQPAHRQTPVAVMTADYSVDDATRRELTELRSRLYFKPLWLEDLSQIIAKLVADP